MTKIFGNPALIAPVSSCGPCEHCSEAWHANDLERYMAVYTNNHGIMI